MNVVDYSSSSGSDSEDLPSPTTESTNKKTVLDKGKRKKIDERDTGHSMGKSALPGFEEMIRCSVLAGAVICDSVCFVIANLGHLLF
jgi:hypothetical protein